MIFDSPEALLTSPFIRSHSKANDLFNLPAGCEVQWVVSNFYPFWKFSRRSTTENVRFVPADILDDNPTAEQLDIHKRKICNRLMSFKAQMCGFPEDELLGNLSKILQVESVPIDQVVENPVWWALIERDLLRMDPNTHLCSFPCVAVKETVSSFVSGRKHPKSFVARLKQFFY